MTRDAASQRQVQAADPGASTWLSANAGSGKTRVLTDRVARLLLNGVDPQRILCLTYTKAAATEMQNRLFRRLGDWAMQEAGALRQDLALLGVEGGIGDDTLARARRLFARAIETPGGLRIQTIHSFCASLLRRFPLEAGVSPQFAELDDRAARLLRDEIIEEMADGGAPGLVADLARHVTDEDFGSLMAEVVRTRAAFEHPLTLPDCLAAFGLAPAFSQDELLSDVFLGGEADWLAEVCAVLATGLDTDTRAAAHLAKLSLSLPDLAVLRGLEAILLYSDKAGKAPNCAKIGAFPTKNTREALGPLLDRLNALMLRVEAARPRRLALAAAQKTAVLHSFAARFLPEYAARKAARGTLDFDDLIVKARLLLTDPSVAQWVLFRLDGGIDHILVDEAQDTSPEQWRVIDLLAQEFTAGHGTQDSARTIFVVGDKKQSIYSFQGADLQAFDAMKAHFRKRLADVDTHLSDLTLEYSFRSAAAILRVVDLTFDTAADRDLGGEVKHIAFRADMPGRVDLWPVIAKAEAPDQGNWYDPTDLVSDQHHDARLAARIADAIKGMIESRVCLPAKGGARVVTAGDVLILVQRRGGLFSQIIAACKVAGLAVAGADRLKLGAELAVRDLGALLAFLATPEDDLSLAAALRSPLFGWTQGQLHRLAQGRTGYLWAALRDAGDAHPDTLAMLHDLRDQADFLRPYDLIDRALTRHGGRRRLIARLGDEAEDGIDELLAQALAYERRDVPSLTGFLGWLSADDTDIKRQADQAGGRIRVMTVHGAKGLEAPIVILPETQDRRASPGDPVIPGPDGAAIWRTSVADSPALVADAVAQRQDRMAQERLRLLYVAMTRAQNWLIVAAAGDTKSETCWYNIVAAGMTAAGAVDLTDGTRRVATGVWPEPLAAAPADMPAAMRVMPGWALLPAGQPDDVALLSPSDLGGPKAMPGDADPTEEAAAKRRGTELHLLLQHLPDHPEEDWKRLAQSLIGADGEAVERRLAEAGTVLRDPALSALFAPGTLAEVPLTGMLGGRTVLGTIDRLVIAPDRILAVDYKSNRLIPERAADVPEGLLRQMGAYCALLDQIYPGHAVEVALLWTGAPSLMPLPRALVMAALQRAGFP